MFNYVSCKDKSGEYKAFKVPVEVGNYVRQLEGYIRYPDKSKLLEVYSERFATVCPKCNRRFTDADNVENIDSEDWCLRCEKLACEELLNNEEDD